MLANESGLPVASSCCIATMSKENKLRGVSSVSKLVNKFAPVAALCMTGFNVFPSTESESLSPACSLDFYSQIITRRGERERERNLRTILITFADYILFNF